MRVFSKKSVSLLTQATIRRQLTGLMIISLLMVARLSAAAGQLEPQWHPVDEIKSAAENYVKLSAGVSDEHLIPTAGYLDPRLQLPHCSKLLEPFLRPGAKLIGRTIVGVRCAGARQWKIYLPVYVSVIEKVLIARNAMPRGHVVQASDVELADRDISGRAGDYLLSENIAVGRRLKRSVVRGVVLSLSATQADVVIKRGQTVTLTLSNAALNINMAGNALSDGAVDERIKVKNAGSGRIVEGLVRSAERVEVLSK